MGYRLNVSKVIDTDVLGSKLYGYVEDMNKLSSVKWLIENRYLTQENVDFPDWYGSPCIILNKREFKEYMELYYKDLNEFRNPDKTSMWEMHDELKELIEEDCSKYLEWY